MDVGNSGPVTGTKISNHNWAQENTTTYGIENQCPVLGRAQNCGGVKAVNGTLTPPLHLDVFCKPTT